ncbi:Tat pathway signal protein [Phytoactinopolyspora mesophila]|uniref:Tat pathway signal protein n=1 Tax=Phytoactinopolyspora mesophila TaxID=2650750 RepID=A0A7K3M1T1_9ACTN|nr:Tat pathway signal protein [Phytoactinopolyspora mesophila]NDL57200.1 Tat pathway signal protein [Phytoactinopolyspora mesophila]
MINFRLSNGVGPLFYSLVVCTVLAVVTGLGQAVPASPSPESASSGAPDRFLDVVDLGDTESEAEHDFEADESSVADGANGQAARVAHRTDGSTSYLQDLHMTMRVDPARQNYVTLKLWGGDTTSATTIILVDGEQANYQSTADYEPIRTGTGDGAVEGRFFYATSMLPLSSTQGRSTVQITIRTLTSSVDSSRPYYEIYTHTQPWVEPAEGDLTGYEPEPAVAPGMSKEEEQELVDGVRTLQIDLFDSLSTRSDNDANFAMPISRYQDELRFYSEALLMDWSPARTAEEKRAGLERIFQSIDVYTRRYYGDVKSLGSGGHQSDWGGYYAALGEALYIVENLIADDEIYGTAEFEAFLDEPFETETEDGPNSIAGVDWEGGELSRGEAWERVLKANFDFARSRLSYIYNQMMYTYEGAWKAHEGLRVIGSDFYEGKERSHRIVGESLGWEPFLGEEVLVGPEGEDLDVYHSLFQHDQNVVYTDDYLQVIMKGHARSKLDDNGEVVRRRPYGEHYTGITHHGLTRENGYVGNYGESTNYLPSWFFRTLGHEGDEAINDEILKLALRNNHARGQTRYPGVNGNGERVMYMQQVVDDRNTAYPGKIAYGTGVDTGRGLLYASLEQYMAEYEERYAGAEWDEYWEYAREASGWAQQQLMDNQYFNHFGHVRSNHKYDLRLDQTYAYLTETRDDYDRFDSVAARAVLPQTDLDRYTDEELSELGVSREDHEDSYAWVDIDNLFVSVRDGDTRIFGNLHMRNRGFARNGRLHVMEPTHDHIVQVATEGVLQYEDYTLRSPAVEQAMFYDRSTGYDASLALAGELSPIAYQPGVGTTVRDNWNEDTPYSGYPDLISTRYGDYFIAVNTTREVYGNTKTHTVELPAGFTGDTVDDLVSGAELTVDDGTISIEAFTAVILDLATTDVAPEAPDAVDVVVATPGAGGVGLTWRAAAGAESYTISRATREGGRYRTIAEGVTGTSHIDDTRSRAVNVTHYYKVTPVNAVGDGRPSSPVAAQLTVPHTPSLLSTDWRDDLLGTVDAGKTTVDGDTITISGGSGSGFGGGDDSVLDERGRPDSMVLVSTLAQGSVSVSAQLTAGQDAARGVMLRDELADVARYVYLGVGADGNLTFGTRNRLTQADISETHLKIDPRDLTPRSPYTVPLDGEYAAEEYPYVRLVRLADSHTVLAQASADGQHWQQLGTQKVPMVDVINAGVVATDEASFDDVAVEPVDDELPLVTGWFNEQSGTIRWTKPTHAYAFDLYRTRDPELARTDPRDDDAWELVAGGVRSWSHEDVVYGGEMYYKVVARYVDGRTTVSPEPARIAGDSLESVVREARSLDPEDFTAVSWAAFDAEITAVEEVMDDPGADEGALIKRVYDAYDLLVAVYRDSFEESDPDVWAPSGSAPSTYTRTIDDSYGRTGQRSLHFTSTDTTYDASHNLWFRSNKGGSPITATPGTTYKVSFWYQLSDYEHGSGVGAYYFIRSYSGGSGVGTDQRNWIRAEDTAPGEWRYFEREYTTEGGSVDNVVIDFGFRGSSGEFRVDDLRVEPVEE